MMCIEFHEARSHLTDGVKTAINEILRDGGFQIMIQFKSLRIGTLLLAACIGVVGVTSEASAQRNREAGKAKAAKRIGVGAAIGGAAGGLIGGRKGVLVGAGAGAGGGAIYHAHKKHQYRKRHPRVARRHYRRG